MGRLVRCRLIIDAQGISIKAARHYSVVKYLSDLGKANFPELTASITIVRAPKVFTQIWILAEKLMTPTMKKKIRILGNDFVPGIADHAGISMDRAV